jgi:hypothetical protein
LLLRTGNCFAADELYLIISPNTTTLTAKGFVGFDAIVYNATDRRVKVPAPYGGFNVVWRLRDICGVRPEREGNYADIGTHTVDPYVLNPRSAIRCEHLGASIPAEPGDILEFYITIERKLKSGAIQTIRSNSVVMYRPQVGEEQK